MRSIIFIFVATILSINVNAKTLNKVELLEDFSTQHITINFGDKTYCIEATESGFIPVNDIQGCQKITDVSIMTKGAVCIEDDETVCNKINRISSGVFWGSGNKIRFSQSLGELEKTFDKSDDSGVNKGKQYYKKSVKLFKKKKYHKAYEWAKKSAALDYKGGYYGLGLAFLKGYGVEDKDKEQAIKWFRKAAEKGHTRAQVKLASLLRFDNPDETIKWLMKAAEQDNLNAINNIGYMWAAGHMSTFGDNTEAYKWYIRSAKLGNKVGQYNVCRALYYGKGVSKNAREAQKWCQRSVDQGYKKAQGLLEKTKSW